MTDLINITASLLLSIAVHEMGHIITAKLLGVKFKLKSISSLGMRFEFETFNRSVITEIMIFISGSTVGLFTTALIIKTSLINYDFWLSYCLISSTLALFNLLPIMGLDGGAIISCILDRLMFPDISLRISKVISVICSLILWAIAVRVQLRSDGGQSLSIMSIFLLFKSIF